MAKVSEVYGGAYLTGAEVGNRTHRLQIADVAVEEVGENNEQKLVVYFAGAKKGLILNKTNSSILAGELGDETTSWSGATVEVFTLPVNYAGKTVPGIRVRVVPAPAPVMAGAAPAADSIPF